MKQTTGEFLSFSTSYEPPDVFCERASHIVQFSGPYQSRIGVACLYQLDDPVSPHLAVKLARERLNTAPEVDEAAVSFGVLIDSLRTHSSLRISISF